MQNSDDIFFHRVFNDPWWPHDGNPLTEKVLILLVFFEPTERITVGPFGCSVVQIGFEGEMYFCHGVELVSRLLQMQQWDREMFFSAVTETML